MGISWKIADEKKTQRVNELQLNSIEAISSYLKLVSIGIVGLYSTTFVKKANLYNKSKPLSLNFHPSLPLMVGQNSWIPHNDFHEDGLNSSRKKRK